MSRNIKIKVGTQTSLIKVTTSASTLGELKKELTNVNWKNTTVIDRDSKASYVLDDAALPVVDCTLFVMPMEAKSGAYIELSYKEAKAKIKHLKEMGIEIPFNYTQATTGRMNEFLEEYEASITKDVTNVTPTELHLKPGVYLLTIEGGTEVIEKIVIPEGYIDMRILVDTTTIKDLDDEYTLIQKQLKR